MFVNEGHEVLQCEPSNNVLGKCSSSRRPYAFTLTWDEFLVCVLCAPQPEGGESSCFLPSGILCIICEMEKPLCVCLFHHLSPKYVLKDFVRVVLSDSITDVSLSF